MTGAELFGALVRAPERLLDEEVAPLAWVTPRLAGIVVVGGMVFGFVVGVNHSGLQAVFAALKMPLVLLLPPLLCGPALSAAAGVVGLDLPPRRAAVAGAVAMARVSVFALALAPIFWLGARTADAYRFTALGTTLVLLCGGLAGLRVLAHAPTDITRAPLSSRGVIVLTSALAFGLVTAQTGWLLRPFILRPHLTPELLQPPESDVFTEIGRRVVGRVR